MIGFPIGDDSIYHKGLPRVTYGLLAVNILVFLFQQTLSGYEMQGFFVQYASIPQFIIHGAHLQGLVTSMFLHGGRMHLLGNMLFLRVFADNIEYRLGPVKFLLFYLAGGIVASFAHILFNWGSMVPAIGASGAIAAVLGAYISYFPDSRIKVFDIMYHRIFYVPALHFLGFWIVFQIISGMGSMGSMGGGVARWAHIGGFVFGLLFAIKTGGFKPTWGRNY